MTKKTTQQISDELSSGILSTMKSYKESNESLKHYSFIIRGDDKNVVDKMIGVYSTAIYNVCVSEFNGAGIYDSNREALSEIILDFTNRIIEELRLLFNGTHKHSPYLLNGRFLDDIPDYELPFLCIFNIYFVYSEKSQITMDWQLDLLKRDGDTFKAVEDELVNIVTVN